MEDDGVVRGIHFIVSFLFAANLASCTSEREIWIGAFLTVDVSAGGWSSEGILPAIQMAIEDVNNDSTILAEYDLRMEWRDTKVSSPLIIIYI